ncbi:MAG: transketolase, partial [Sedimentisphaerales bacterium]|nr:transketolase [Sedimentisphaerales bacterium]
MVVRGKGGHIGAALSIVEILAVLYDQVLNIHPSDPRDPGRDRFILSKGHAGIALYAILAEKGFFPKSWLATYGQAGTNLGGHPDMHKIPGIEASTGALGHGFGFGVGQALAGKMDN